MDPVRITDAHLVVSNNALMKYCVLEIRLTKFLNNVLKAFEIHIG